MLAVIDIDGVVADVRHRLHHLHGHRPSGQRWQRFFADASDDQLLPEGAALVLDLAREHEIVWLTGRPERLRRVTRRWLRQHGLPDTELHMRPDSDRRPARVYKLGQLRRLGRRGIAAFVDDDPEVVQAALASGIPAVLADWVPRGPVLTAAQEEHGRT